MVDIKIFPVHIICTNCIILTDTSSGEIAVVDPGMDNEKVLSFLDSQPKEKIKYVFLTHGHYDHIGGVQTIADRYDAQVVISALENELLQSTALNLSGKFKRKIPSSFPADILLNDGDVLYLGETKIVFMHTPGHTSGSGCFIFDNVIISGDTLFFEEIGRVDLPTGNGAQMLKSLERLQNLKGDYIVYPGHGPSTTLNHERQNNHYMIYKTLY